MLILDRPTEREASLLRNPVTSKLLKLQDRKRSGEGSIACAFQKAASTVKVGSNRSNRPSRESNPLPGTSRHGWVVAPTPPRSLSNLDPLRPNAERWWFLSGWLSTESPDGEEHRGPPIS